MLTEIDLKAFDYWRILNSFIKFDPHMPRMIKLHFREIEINVVSEYAWEEDSPVVKVVKRLCQTEENSAQRNDLVMQPYNMFFKRILQLTAERV